jgi:dihydrofolate reductase
MKKRRTIALIAAMARNRVIGIDNSLPWRLPADLKRFRELTSGHTVIMGRKTYESLGKPLPNRRNIVITTQRSYKVPGCDIAHSLGRALQLAKDDEVFVIGGEQIFRQAMPKAKIFYLTIIDADFKGDASFPKIENDQDFSKNQLKLDLEEAPVFSELDWENWKVSEAKPHSPDEKNQYRYIFYKLERYPAKTKGKKGQVKNSDQVLPSSIR